MREEESTPTSAPPRARVARAGGSSMWVPYALLAAAVSSLGRLRLCPPPDGRGWVWGTSFAMPMRPVTFA